MFRCLAGLVFRSRGFYTRKVKAFSADCRRKHILELGSGREPKCSLKRFFDGTNTFIQSDVVPGLGYEMIDVTNMTFENEFDVVLCLSVLEHVFDVRKAVQNIHLALKPDGIAIIAVPGRFPLHDEPTDYWRFTEHSLRELLKQFKRIEIRHQGIREYPTEYYIEAVK